MKTSEKRRWTVAGLRDLAVAAVTKHGQFEDLGVMKVLACQIGNVKISYRTPFQKLPPPKLADSYETAAVRQSFRGSLGYGIDIWADGRKVMNVQWQHDEMHVGGFKPGDWEALVAAA